MSRADRRPSVTGPAPGSPASGASTSRSALLPLVGEAKLVITEVEHVALVDALVVDAHPLEVDPVGRPEVLDEVGAVAADDRRVLAGDVSILDRQVGGFRSPADDELILVDAVLL